MITVEKARSGHPILKKNGRFLASSFDPVQEAAVWAERIAVTAKDFESIAVLGLGSGYHVAALVSMVSDKRIVVIEGDREVAREAKCIVPALALGQSLCVVEPDWMRLVENHLFCDLLNSSFLIAQHGPSCQLSAEYFGSVEKLLVGRENLQFLLQLKARPELCAILDPDAIQSLDPQLISIKTLQRLFATNSIPSRERRLWKVLEELVL